MPVVPGGKLVALSTTYGSVKKMLEHRSARTGEELVILDVDYSSLTADQVRVLFCCGCMLLQ